MGRESKAFTRSSISSQSRLTFLFDTPEPPMALTRSSTARVEIPCMEASWITAVSAFSAVRRGSRNEGRYEPLRSLGMARSIRPARVSHARSR
jgi:hypothetical protein